MDVEFDPSFDCSLIAATTVLPSGSMVSSLKAMQEAARKMQPPGGDGSLAVNPKTADKLFPITKKMLADDTVFGISLGPFPLVGTPVYRSQLMPKRTGEFASQASTASTGSVHSTATPCSPRSCPTSY